MPNEALIKRSNPGFVVCCITSFNLIEIQKSKLVVYILNHFEDILTGKYIGDPKIKGKKN